MYSKLFVVFCILPLAISQLSSDPEELLNWCMDAKHHKSSPGPEDELYHQCKPWKQRSCCTHNTTREAHIGKLYNFNYDHCRNMSERCRKHFLQDLCFFECSPNVGPWIVSVNMKTRKERFYKVPLCKSDCDVWFKDCINDYTCTDNWFHWDWGKGGNTCRKGTVCRKFKEVFGTAEKFCQKVWDDAWEYTPDDQPCMRIWFNGEQGNPNNNIAKWKVEQLMKQKNSAANPKNISLMVLFFSIAVTAYIMMLAFLPRGI